MKIFIDTNIFYNNWLLKSAHFQLLSNFIKNGKHTLLASEIVIKEVENKFEMELSDTRQKINDLISKAKNFTETTISINSETLSNIDYKFKDIINEAFPSNEIVEINKIDNQKLIEKAIKRKLPFKENEKGFRDAAIWLSILNHIKSSNTDEDIIFITNNYTDFFNKKENPASFHEDLQDDIDEFGVKNRFLAFNSLKSFMSEFVNEALHSFIHDDTDSVFEKFGETIEKEFELFAISYMNNMMTSEILEILDDSSYSFSRPRIFRNHNFDFFEGTEDPKIYNCYFISANEIAIDYSFNLRRCTLALSLGSIDYVINKKEIDDKFYNVSKNGPKTECHAYFRAYYTGSAVINIENEKISQLQIDSIWIR